MPRQALALPDFRSCSGMEARGARTCPTAAPWLRTLHGGREGFAQSKDTAHTTPGTTGITSSCSPTGLGWTFAAAEWHQFHPLSSSSSAHPQKADMPQRGTDY